jgi:hypothetical protein
MQGWHFTLRDAHVTIARELGFDSWKALLAEVEGGRRWEPVASSDISRRAFGEAQALGHPYCTDSHFLLALFKPPAPTASAEVLAELGLSYEQVRDQLKERTPRPRRPGRTGPQRERVWVATRSWWRALTSLHPNSTISVRFLYARIPHRCRAGAGTSASITLTIPSHEPLGLEQPARRAARAR